MHQEEAKYNVMIHFPKALSVALICIGPTEQKNGIYSKNCEEDVILSRWNVCIIFIFKNISAGNTENCFNDAQAVKPQKISTSGFSTICARIKTGSRVLKKFDAGGLY